MVERRNSSQINEALMSARQILTSDLNDLIPASASGRVQLPEREALPKNTVSFEELIEIAGSGEGQTTDAAAVLRRFISRLPPDK